MKLKFWTKITQDGDCWRWTGSMHQTGYGYTSDGGKAILAHRAVYAAWFGSIPKGTVVDHLCRNRWCVNPLHLEPVSYSENIRRAWPYRKKGLKSHCVRGHKYDETTYIDKVGKRHCRVCATENERAFRERKRANNSNGRQ